jgi:hypothetical protein
MCRWDFVIKVARHSNRREAEQGTAVRAGLRDTKAPLADSVFTIKYV